MPEGVWGEAHWHVYPWLWLILGIGRAVPQVIAATLIISALLSWRNFTQTLRGFAARSPALSSDSITRLVIHLGCVVALLGWTAIGLGLRPTPLFLVWIWTRLALEIAVTATWVVAALPPSFLLDWYRGAQASFAIGAGAGIGAKVVNHFRATPIEACRAATFKMVATILHLLGQSVVLDFPHAEIGTRSFSVELAPVCSGLDGIAITSLLVGIYLWRYRSELRFPLSLILLPAAMLLAWILNSVRIVLLILIGGWSPTIALNGFHSVAGWLSLSLVGCATIVASFRIPAFRPVASAANVSARSAASFYLVPLIAVIATAMLTKAIHPGFDLLYPERVGVAAAALWYYRRDLTAIWYWPSMMAIAVGVVVFCAWIVIVPSRDAAFDSAFAAGLGSLSITGRVIWMAFRVIGATITVPIAEELAFRGYLMRKLVADDFDSVPIGNFTWLSFLASSILFGAMHTQWIAGTLAGMAFAGAAYCRGKLSDAIAAHAVTNAMLSAYAIATHCWSFWT